MKINLVMTININYSIFIAKGNRPPTLNDYDFKKSTMQSDVIMLQSNDSSSMEDYYIIGVYGYQNTTFSISVTS